MATPSKKEHVKEFDVPKTDSTIVDNVQPLTKRTKDLSSGVTDLTSDSDLRVDRGRKTQSSSSSVLSVPHEKTGVPLSDDSESDLSSDEKNVIKPVDKSNTSTEDSEAVNAEVLLFGKNLEKQPLEGTIELDSDQDSTGGEEDEVLIGKNLK